MVPCIGLTAFVVAINAIRLKSMATYTYKCTNPECEDYDKTFDVVHSMLEPNRTDCKTCGQSTLVKVIGANPVMLVGEGWDRNDSRGYLHDKRYN